jgi:hypothetical protein
MNRVRFSNKPAALNIFPARQPLSVAFKQQSLPSFYVRQPTEDLKILYGKIILANLLNFFRYKPSINKKILDYQIGTIRNENAQNFGYR